MHGRGARLTLKHVPEVSDFRYVLCPKQGLTLAHFSAQPEPFLTRKRNQNAPEYPRKPYRHPVITFK